VEVRRSADHRDGCLRRQAEAERWLTAPATALDQRRPIDRLASTSGVEMVEQLLGRLRYGVYT
jgi:putative toxin-antitoxin system antitoxin component (TIGR02293 family)